MCGHITSLLFSHKIGCSWLKYFFQSKAKRVSLESLHWNETCSMPSFARNEKVDACVALSYYKTITLSAFVYKLLHIFKWSNFRTKNLFTSPSKMKTLYSYKQNIAFEQPIYLFVLAVQRHGFFLLNCHQRFESTEGLFHLSISMFRTDTLGDFTF